MVQYQLPAVFHALSDPTRVALVEQLAAGDAAVGELARPFRMTLTAVQKHLGVLERAGVIDCSKQGRVRTCRLRREALAQISDWALSRQALWERRLDALGDHLESHPD